MLERFYHCLLEHAGRQHWWPVTPTTPPELAAWEVAVGAVLTQNTNWHNVEKALAALTSARRLSPDCIAGMAPEELAILIRPSGYFNVKARRLQALAQWWLDRQGWALNPGTLLAEIRGELLGIHGVGPETADSILLYAFQRPSFVVDAYTRRLLLRHGLIHAKADYNTVQQCFVRAIPVDLECYQEYHALIVVLAKQYCRTTPHCSECPLNWHLESSGRTGA